MIDLLFLGRLIDIANMFKEAIIVGILLSIAASMLGVILVLKRFSMIGDGLSHVGFGALAVALALNTSPLVVAVPIVILAAYVLLRIGEKKLIKSDAAIALISSSALAIGYLVGNLTAGFKTDVSSYMFGSITTATKEDLYYILPITLIIIAFYVIYQNKIFAVTFDENFAKAVGINTRIYNIGLAILTAVVIVFGMRIMGTLLISSIIIFPALTSMRLFKNFKVVIIFSAFLSVLCFLIAFFGMSKYPSGASIVIINLVFFLIASFISLLQTKFSRK